MTSKTIQITEQNINQRLDMYIASLDLDLSRSMAQKMIEKGQVVVNDKIPKTSYKTKLGDVVKITFEELADIKAEAPPIVKRLLEQKNNISEQLILLRRNRHIVEVQKYIDDLYHHKSATAYTKYLIDRYYYNLKGLTRPEKNCLERMFKLLLH